MTFSIVAFDKDANEVGFAIASMCWNAGVVCFAEAGKGAVAHQAAGNASYHPIFLEQLKQNKNLDEIINHFKTIDKHIESRQIGMVNLDDETSYSFTGINCPSWAGHKKGKNYACQGNILVGQNVIDSMSLAFEATDGNLLSKLYAALQAGDEAGGDARGKQSARVCVKKIVNTNSQISEIVTDFNISDHDNPVQEIGRQLTVFSNYQIFKKILNAFPDALSDDERLKIVKKAHNFIRDKHETRYMTNWKDLGYIYHSLKAEDEAAECFKVVIKLSPNFSETLKATLKSMNISELFLKKVFDEK